MRRRRRRLRGPAHQARAAAEYPNVDDVVGLEHTYGCGVAIDAPDAAVPIRTLRNITLNPNFGNEVMVVSLGCEKLQPERLLPPGTFEIVDERNVADVGATGEATLDVVCLQDDGARRLHVDDRFDHGPRPTSTSSASTRAARDGAGQRARGRRAVRRQRRVQRRDREPGGRLLQRPAGASGATVMFSEVTEVRDGIDQLTARASTPEVADAMIREMAWYDAYLDKGKVDRSANTDARQQEGRPVEHRREGDGLDHQERQRADHRRAVAGREAARPRHPSGLVYAATPASDFICGTLQMAAGMNLHVFTTGRGTPYGLAAVPVIKVATRSDLARRWHDLMDINAGASPTATRRSRRWAGRCSARCSTSPAAAEDLGRAVEAAQRAGAVQPGAGDVMAGDGMDGATPSVGQRGGATLAAETSARTPA
jgi:galactarate dehydratase